MGGCSYQNALPNKKLPIQIPERYAHYFLLSWWNLAPNHFYDMFDQNKYLKSISSLENDALREKYILKCLCSLPWRMSLKKLAEMFKLQFVVKQVIKIKVLIFFRNIIPVFWFFRDLRKPWNTSSNFTSSVLVK